MSEGGLITANLRHLHPGIKNSSSIGEYLLRLKDLGRLFTRRIFRPLSAAGNYPLYFYLTLSDIYAKYTVDNQFVFVAEFSMHVAFDDYTVIKEVLEIWYKEEGHDVLVKIN